MIEFLRIFRSLRNFQREKFEYEECRLTPTERVFTIYGIERKTGHRVKVCEFTCGLDEKVCHEKIERAIKKLNRDK